MIKERYLLFVLYLLLALEVGILTVSITPITIASTVFVGLLTILMTVEYCMGREGRWL